MKKVSEWLGNHAVAELNAAAREQEIESGWTVAQKTGQYMAVGIALPALRNLVNSVCPGFDRVHFALGVDRGKPRDLFPNDFTLGTEQAKPLYLGIRIHRGSQTVTRALHREIFETAVDHLQRATSPDLVWQPRDQFWSVWAYLPTSRDGEVLSAHAYKEFAIDEALKGFRSVKSLWDGDQSLGSAREFTAGSSAPTRSQRPNSERATFEYLTLDSIDVSVLNSLGADGWEVVGTTVTPTGSGVLLKRQR
jgi:hypothetical protein